ncbi:MAG: hypothetical protein BMS9Abin31_0256 [Gammaproteobacteria bacterium]|nr:MAG: hypothetical protein BMS9Abin31_0256 [Gammaproteobacteria bacterium]
MKNKKIIDKIFKCLRLSKSTNPNEAASALRQARRLMQMHDIREEQVKSANIIETHTSSIHFINPPYWLVALSELVAGAFSCRAYIAKSNNLPADFCFIGVGSRTELACYTFTVLQRLLRRERSRFILNLKNMNKTEKTRRGNVFAQAWLFRITRTIKGFCADPVAEAEIDRYIKEMYGQTADFQSTAATPAEKDIDAISLGLRAAEGVSLYRPVESDTSYTGLMQQSA